MIRVRRFPLVVYAGLMAIVCAPVWADDSEIQMLRKEVEELKQKVRKLEEQQAAKPESGQAVSSAQPSPAAAAKQPAPQAASLPPASAQPSPTAAAKQPAPQAASPPPASAQPSPTAAAKQAAPQAASPPPTQNATPIPVAAASSTNSIPDLRLSWSRVTKNMSKAEIVELLGQPSKEMRIDGKLVWYYYYPGIGGASVFFKSNGHVSSNQPPNVGWW